jgi:Flp pilus assembly pilin Flp
MMMILRRLAGLRFLADRAGAAAVEFALVVPMLVLIILSTLEAGWYMVQTIMLDRALDRTVRELRVGSFANPTQASMRQRVCEEAMVLIDCQQNLALELIPITQQGTGYPSDRARCINRATPVAPVLRFVPGGRSQTMFVRACFVVSPLTPGLGLGLAMPQDESGAVRIIAKSAFMNEPP